MARALHQLYKPRAPATRNKGGTVQILLLRHYTTQIQLILSFLRNISFNSTQYSTSHLTLKLMEINFKFLKIIFCFICNDNQVQPNTVGTL